MAPFVIRQRVRFGETDAQQVVYYANYLLYAEVGRMAYLREIGVEWLRGLPALGLDFTIGEATVRYRAPLRFDDEFDIKVSMGEIRRASFSLDYTIDRADGLHCAKASTIQVVIDRATRRATPIHPDIRARLEAAHGAPGGSAAERP